MVVFKPLGCNCHGHSAEGSLDGGSLVKKLVKRAKDLGRPAISLTDHGQMSSLAILWEEAKKAGIMPIHGIEIYLDSPWDEKKVLKNGLVEPTTRHMTVLFKTQKAYEYFCKLTPIAHERAIIRFGDLKPIITIDELKAIGDDICLGSGCFGSAVAKTLMNSGPEAAEKVYQEVRDIVKPGCFFVEIMPHILDSTWVRPQVDYATKTILKNGFFKPNDLDDCGLPIDFQKPVNEFMVQMGLKYKDKIVISEDSHLSERNDKAIQDLRLGDNWRFSCAYSMEPTDVWAAAIKKQMPHITDKMIEEWVDNSYELIENFKDYTFLTSRERVLLPTMESVYGIEFKDKSTKQQLKELIQKHKRYPTDPEKARIYSERLKMEIDVLTNNGYDFLPYFFTVEDACTSLREMGYFTAPRGSAASSIILYLLGISIVDPIEWNLPFSRFMNAGRIKGGSLPDIDLDVSIKEDCMKYLKDRYGSERVASISTSLTMKLKLSIRDVERQFFKKVRPETEEMLKMMPMITSGVDDELWLNGYEDETTGEHVKGYLELEEPGSVKLRQYIENEPEIWDTVIRCLAIPKSRGKHASGVIITPGPLADYMPMTLVSEELVTAYSMKPVEYIGAIKFDFLGLKTLESLAYSFKALKKEKNITVPWECPPHDDKVFSEIINNGKHTGLFQIGGKSILPYLKKAPPKTVGDISNLIALCRPGALDAPAPDGSNSTAADFYVDVVNGTKKPYYIHPSLEPILKETHSILCVAENTEVITMDGIKLIKDVLINDKVKTEDGSFQRVLFNWNKGKQKTLKIRANNGKEIQCTPEHRFLTNVGWIEAKDLNIKKHLIKMDWEFDKKEDIGTDKDWLIGLLLADGDLCAQTPSIACTTKEQAEVVIEVAKNVFKLESPYVKYAGRCWYAVLRHREKNGSFARDFERNPAKQEIIKLGLLRKDCYSKFVPNNATLKMIVGFIEGDGCLFNKTIRIKNKQMADKIYETLCAYRIECSYFESKEALGTVNTIRWSDVKNKIYSLLKFKKNRTFQDTVCVPRERLAEYYNNFNDHYTHLNFKNRKELTWGIVRSSMAETIDTSERWGKITKISEGEEIAVRDLSVENIHSYVSNGFISHNCYQEQLMSIVKAILDLDDMQADDWRRAVGKKDKKLMDKLCGDLKQGAIAKGWTEEQSNKLLSTIIASSRYSFNKSHAISYAYIGYIEAWWKLHYPEYYWLGKLTAFQDKTDKMLTYMEEARRFILQPCIIRSHPYEWKTENGLIRAPLSTLKGVGSDAAVKAQEVIKAGLETGWETELEQSGNLHFRWGQALLAVANSKQDKKRGFNASTLLNMLYNGTFDIFLEEKSNYKNLPVLAEQVRDVLDSKATGGNVKKGQTVAISGIEDDIMLNIWRSENNAVHVYQFTQLEKVKEELVSSGFVEADVDEDYVMTRAPVWKDKLKQTMSHPQIDVLYNWTEFSKDPEAPYKYMPVFKGGPSTKLCAVVGMITSLNYKLSKNNNTYINLTLNTGIETITNINLFGKVMDMYSEKVKNKMICMVIFKPNRWNSMFTPEVVRIISFFEIV